jgi:PadR family transcriptional regulator, regulatory protein AphA
MVTNGSTTTAHALLGLLALRRWTTYELAKQVQRGLGWFWPRAERKLYDEPKRLVAEGLATSRSETTGRRPRTVYAITPKGRRALRDWLGEPSNPPSLEFEALVRVFFADSGTKESLDATLAGVEATAQTRIDEMRSMIDASRDVSYEFNSRLHVNALAQRFQLDHQQLQLEWARWARRQVATWKSTTEPGDWDSWAALEAHSSLIGRRRPSAS